MTKQNLSFLISVLILLAILAGAYYLYQVFTASRIYISKFTGNLVSVNGDAITLHGVFYSPSGNVPEDLAAERDFSFRVDDSTAFQKIFIRWPTEEEFAKLGNRFNLQDLPREEGPGSLADLADLSPDMGVYIEADFPVSIHNAQSPVASYVLYRAMSPLGETTPGE